MFNIILYQPEIPQNTGNIIRLCANTGAKLHLIEPLGFIIDDKHLKRAALDYINLTSINTYTSIENCLQNNNFSSIYAISTKGTNTYSNVVFSKNDAFIFGPETKGLPNSFLEKFNLNNILKVPMQNNSRSLNLSNTVAIVIYEAWRQNYFS